MLGNGCDHHWWESRGVGIPFPRMVMHYAMHHFLVLPQAEKVAPKLQRIREVKSGLYCNYSVVSKSNHILYIGHFYHIVIVEF